MLWWDLATEAEGDAVLGVTFAPERSREDHLTVAGLPIFSKAYYTAHPFDATTLDPPLGSSAYKVGTVEQGRTIAFQRVKDYWAKDLPLNRGQGNFDEVRYEYYRERQVGFEAFKSGAITFHEDFTSINWAQGYDFPAAKDGRVQRRIVPDQAPSGAQGWWLNTRRGQFKDPRIRQALGFCFDFEWTNKNIMYGLYRRTFSYFQNSPMAATGMPGPDELKLLEPHRGQVPDTVFGEAIMPPVDRTGRSCSRATSFCRRPVAGATATSSSCRRASRSASSSWISAAGSSGIPSRSSGTCSSSASTRASGSSTPRNTRRG